MKKIIKVCNKIRNSETQKLKENKSTNSLSSTTSSNSGISETTSNIIIDTLEDIMVIYYDHIHENKIE